MRLFVDRLCVFAALWLLAVARAGAEVVINEFVYDPVGSDTGKEWVELYNAGETAVSLQGWSLQVDNGAFPGTVKAKLCGVLEPHRFYLIKESEAAISTSTVADFISGTIALGNASGKADGLQIVDAGGFVHDRVVYGKPDSENLCGGFCSTAPATAGGFSLSRSTPGAPIFVALASTAATPMAGGVVCEQCPKNSGRLDGVISEVAPSVPSNDWLEIYTFSSANLCGAFLLEGGAVIKIFPSVTPRSGGFGPYVIFHAGRKVADFPDETDATGDVNGNGAIDLSSDESSPGLSGGANQNLALMHADSSFADFLSWTVLKDDRWTDEQKRFYDNAVASTAWSPACPDFSDSCYALGSVRWFDREAESLSRRVSSSGAPQKSRPPALFDWQVGLPSPGRGYDLALQPQGQMLEIFQSPFAPLGGGSFQQSVIVFKAPQASLVSIDIFNVRGLRVRRLVQNILTRDDDAQTAPWDGRDDDNQTVPSGIYVVLLKANEPGGTEHRAQKTVVVARKL